MDKKREKKIEYEDDILSVKKSFNNISAGANEYGSWFDGEVGTPFGYVLAYTEVEGDETAELRFIWKGQLYIRRFNRTLTKHSLVCQAKKFTEEVAGE